MYRQILKAQQNHQTFALCTIVRSEGSTPRRVGSKMLVFPDGQIEGTIGGGEMESLVIEAAQQAILAGKAGTMDYALVDPARGDPGVCGGTVTIFIEPIYPEPTIVVVGMGHVGQAVLKLARFAGFRAVAVDDRPDFANADVLPDADDVVCVSMKQLAEQAPTHRKCYFVLTTRNILVDIDALPALIAQDVPYIGVIGSRRRWQTTRKKLLEVGLTETALEKVRSPIGLELNAETPEEIAVSILAEIIMIERGGDGKPMSH